MIRLLIADDHAVVAEGLRNLLQSEPDMEVLSVARNGREAVAQARETHPDVVVMDYHMDELNGLEATRLIRERSPQTRVVMLSMESDTHRVVWALRAGAAGYLPKKSAAREVVRAIRQVNAGQRYVHEDIAEDVFKALLDGDAPADPFSVLSSRERQVLQLLVEGHNNASVAERLSISPRTVETYRARMMEKLEVYDFASLVRLALRHGVAPLS
jgi:DNA-binding NarL/FixJ family response regulator